MLLRRAKIRLRLTARHLTRFACGLLCVAGAPFGSYRLQHAEGHHLKVHQSRRTAYQKVYRLGPFCGAAYVRRHQSVLHFDLLEYRRHEFPPGRLCAHDTAAGRKNQRMPHQHSHNENTPSCACADSACWPAPACRQSRSERLSAGCHSRFCYSGHRRAPACCWSARRHNDDLPMRRCRDVRAFCAQQPANARAMRRNRAGVRNAPCQRASRHRTKRSCLVVPKEKPLFSILVR